ncbi:MAG: YraN family protein [Acidimicrobiales bacterium]
MVDRSRQARGRFGEDLAARWYAQRGFEVVGRNWRGEGGELDLVVHRPGLVVVVEVKARASAAYGLPAEAVGPTKQRRVRRLGAQWLAGPGRAYGHVEVRFDVASVLGTEVTVIEAAF